MQNMSELLQEFGYITPRLAGQHGFSKFQFYKFVQENELEQVSRGIYTAKDEWADELYIIHKRCPIGIFSHDEAIYYHGLTDREPLIHTLTIYSGYNTSRLTSSENCKFYFVKKELLEVGKTVVNDNCGNAVPMYDLERTVCDIVRSRNNIEVQEFNSVLKKYIGRKDKDLNLLMEYAKMFRVQNIMRKYMEVLL